MAKKELALTFEQALQEYYGGVHSLNAQPIPFTCKCGGKSYPKDSKSDKQLPVMTLNDTFRHIRKVHKERIKNYPDEEELDVTTL